MSRDRRGEDHEDQEGTEPTAEEQAQARALARLIDGLVAGERPPPALPADDRALLETATMIRAGLTEQKLDPARREHVMKGLGVAKAAPPAIRSAPWSRRAPWMIAAVAAAAAVILAIRPPARPPAPRADARAEIPMTEQSRPADPLIGEIPQSAAGEARARMDIIYADRLAGYRSVLLRRGGRHLEGGTQ